MSHWTTEVRFICETALDNNESLPGSDVEAICNAAWTEIFWDSLELFDATYKSVLFPKILLHYYTREIGFETVGLWKLKLNTKLKEILPYYNKLYESELLKFDPMHNVDLERTHIVQHVGEDEGADVRQNKNDGTVRNLYSDTPQGALNGVESEQYLTDARKVTTDNSDTTVGQSNGRNSYTDVYQELLAGNNGSSNYAKLLRDFRDSFLNIDMMVINELSGLFMKLW